MKLAAFPPDAEHALRRYDDVGGVIVFLHFEREGGEWWGTGLSRPDVGDGVVVVLASTTD